MQLLSCEEIKLVSGQGLLAAIPAIPVALLATMGCTAMALITVPFAACKGDGILDGIGKGFYQATMGIQMGWAIEKAAYNW